MQRGRSDYIELLTYLWVNDIGRPTRQLQRRRINLIRFSAINRSWLTGRTAVDYRAGSQPRANKSSIIDNRTTTTTFHADGRYASAQSSLVVESRSGPVLRAFSRSSVQCQRASITDAAERWAVFSLRDTDRTGARCSVSCQDKQTSLRSADCVLCAGQLTTILNQYSDKAIKSVNSRCYKTQMGRPIPRRVTRLLCNIAA